MFLRQAHPGLKSISFQANPIVKKGQNICNEVFCLLLKSNQTEIPYLMDVPLLIFPYKARGGGIPSD